MRDFDDKWIRIECKTGDMVCSAAYFVPRGICWLSPDPAAAQITLPEGIYHRFTLDETNYIKAGHVLADALPYLVCNLTRAPCTGTAPVCWRAGVDAGEQAAGRAPQQEEVRGGVCGTSSGCALSGCWVHGAG